MKKILFNVFVIGLIIAAVYLVTMYSSPIRTSITTTKTAVAGISTSDLSQTSFPKALSNDVKKQFDMVKDQALDVKVGEIMEFLGRSGKIVDDVWLLKANVTATFKEGEDE